jgi:hypothetical protein
LSTDVIGGGWENDGALTHAAHSLHAEDGDFVQAGALYREVYNDGEKARFLDTITGAVGGVKRERHQGTRRPVLDQRRCRTRRQTPREPRHSTPLRSRSRQQNRLTAPDSNRNPATAQ